jgi:hypothetical protein
VLNFNTQVFANMCTIFTIRRNASLLLKGPPPFSRHKPNLPPLIISCCFTDIDALAQIPEEIEVIRDLLENSDESVQVIQSRDTSVFSLVTRPLIFAGAIACQSAQEFDQSQLPR